MMCLWSARRHRRSRRPHGRWCEPSGHGGVSFADTADGVLKALTKTVVETAPGRIVLVIAQVIGELFVERRRRTQAARMSPRCLPRLQHRRPHPSRLR